MTDTSAPDKGGHFTPFIQYKKVETGGIRWPVLKTTLGEDAVPVFTNSEKAKAFARGKGMWLEWGVGRMEPPEFLRWLRYNLTSGLAPLVMVDPGVDPVPGSPESTEGRALEIVRFLAEVEGWQARDADPSGKGGEGGPWKPYASRPPGPASRGPGVRFDRATPPRGHTLLTVARGTTWD
jgi:hypothetical protein